MFLMFQLNQEMLDYADRIVGESGHISKKSSAVWQPGIAVAGCQLHMMLHISYLDH